MRNMDQIAREMLGDAECQNIERRARADAEIGVCNYDAGSSEHGITRALEFFRSVKEHVYIMAHGKRVRRLERMAERNAA